MRTAPANNPTAARRAPSAAWAMRCGVLMSLMLVAGCAALRPMNGIPARYLPDELKAPRRSGKKTIDLSLLRQTPPAEYLIDAGDVLGIYIEGVLGRREEVPPVHFPHNQEMPPALGYPIPVRDDGTISLPLVQPVAVRGLTLLGVEQALRRAYTVEKQILKPGRDRILVTLLKPRTYPVLVIRQESGTDVSAVSSTGFNLGRLKRGTGRVVNLPAYRNDVLHALAETGGLPGLDAENTVYIIRSRRRPTAASGAAKAPPAVSPGANGRGVPGTPAQGPHGGTRFPPIPQGGNRDGSGPDRGMLPAPGAPAGPGSASRPYGAAPSVSPPVVPDGVQNGAYPGTLPSPTIIPPAGPQNGATPQPPPAAQPPRFPGVPSGEGSVLPEGGSFPPPPPLGGPQSYRSASPVPGGRFGMRTSRTQQGSGRSAAVWLARGDGLRPSTVIRGQSPTAGWGYSPSVPQPASGGFVGAPYAVQSGPAWPGGANRLSPATHGPGGAAGSGSATAGGPAFPQVQPFPDPAMRGWEAPAAASGPLPDGTTYGVADWMQNVAGYDAVTIDNPRITKIPIRLAPGETISFTEQDVILNAGDIVFIESRDTEIFYTGGLLGGGQFTLPRDYDIDVLDAIAIAQGQNNNRGGGGTNGLGFSALNQDVTISASNVIILRRLENGTQVPIKVDLYRALRYPQERVLIRPGDYIILQYTPIEAVAAFLERHVLQSAIFGIAAAQVSRGR